MKYESFDDVVERSTRVFATGLMGSACTRRLMRLPGTAATRLRWTSAKMAAERWKRMVAVVVVFVDVQGVEVRVEMHVEGAARFCFLC